MSLSAGTEPGPDENHIKQYNFPLFFRVNRTLSMTNWAFLEIEHVTPVSIA